MTGFFSRLREPSLLRTFAGLSLVVVGVITALQIVVQWALLRDDLLQWERASTSEAIRAEALTMLASEDFTAWQSADAQARFARFFRLALSNPEILRVKLYGPDMRVVWSDEPRLLGVRVPDNNASLQRALAGETVAHLESGGKSENEYERGFGRQMVQLYIPLAFPQGPTPGTARIAGVVELYKDPSRMFSNIVRDRFILVATSVAGALVLYGALFGIVYRASRQIQAQRRGLEQQAEALRLANQELRATQRQLGAAERLAAIGEVSATVAHGIRNPLANIRAAAQVALDAEDEPRLVARYLRAIVDETNRLRQWLSGLLDVIRPFEPRLAPVDLNALVEVVVGLVGTRIEDQAVSVRRVLAPDLPKLQADEVHLQQALLSVVENAVEAVARGGHVEIVTARAAGGPPAVRLTVRDDGEGIPADRLAKVFEPFVTSKTRGTGLGLAITLKVIEAHGGRVEIQSEPGAGTVVTLVLPVERVEASA
jgi:two-component system, NtrC family, sensor histidine kinase HydH